MLLLSYTLKEIRRLKMRIAYIVQKVITMYVSWMVTTNLTPWVVYTRRNRWITTLLQNPVMWASVSGGLS